MAEGVIVASQEARPTPRTSGLYVNKKGAGSAGGPFKSIAAGIVVVKVGTPGPFAR